jgi:hypothetical protein
MGFLDKAKAAAEQAAAKAKEGVQEVQTKRELGQAYEELGKTTFSLVEGGEISHTSRRAFEYLGESPLMAFRVTAAVAAVAKRQVDEILGDCCALGLRTVVMGIDGRDDDVDDRCPADRGRIAKARRWLTCIHKPAKFCLELEVEAAAGPDLSVGLPKAEGPCQKRCRRLGVLVEKVRSDCLCHAPQAMRRHPRCLGEVFREAGR